MHLNRDYDAIIKSKGDTSADGQILTRFLLRFNDGDLHLVYKKEKTEFYKKSLPIVSGMLGLLAAALEYFYGAGSGGGPDDKLPAYISTTNWTFTVLLMVVTIFHAKFTFLHNFVCPMLTVLIFLYISFVDYDYSVGTIYYS